MNEEDRAVKKMKEEIIEIIAAHWGTVQGLKKARKIGSKKNRAW